MTWGLRGAIIMAFVILAVIGVLIGLIVSEYPFAMVIYLPYGVIVCLLAMKARHDWSLKSHPQ